MTAAIPNRNPVKGSAVLITGCSSGIGRESALLLARRGFTVLAGVRRDADADALRSLNLPDLVPVCPLDLTNHEHITAAVEFVADELRRRKLAGLFALVNNAGGGQPAPVELLDLERFSTELRTRVLGSVDLVQQCLPLIRPARGRILWIMTPALMPTPFVASIHACDFAVDCIVRTLDIELKPWGVPNVRINCGGIRTPAGLRTTGDVETLLKQGPPERIGLYVDALRRWAREMAEFDRNRTDPAKVAEKVCTALSAERPKRRYSVGYMAHAARLLYTTS
ncbi:SDR family NAD(P)-dependent oxidoreductase [candidate division WOR-3 bacterium]|nr:SDR family NAD(P)-dependent oxidoreductase [candidate division WOR-3 bacterium]